MAIRKICSQCGSTEIVCTALAKWDPRQDEWVFDIQVDPEYCSECESFDIEEEEIDDEELDAMDTDR